MLIQVAFLCEPSVANLTFEWLFTSMDSDMVDEGPSFVEQSSTIVVLAHIIPQVSPTLFVVLVASGVPVLRHPCLLGRLDSELVGNLRKVHFGVTLLLDILW